jgi:hypothetical protein
MLDYRHHDGLIRPSLYLPWIAHFADGVRRALEDATGVSREPFSVAEAVSNAGSKIEIMETVGLKLASAVP